MSKDFLRKVKKANPFLSDIELLSEYRGEKHPVFFKDKYGCVKIKAGNLLRKRKNKHFFYAAVDKTWYITNYIKINNPELYKKIDIIKAHSASHIEYMAEFGLCVSSINTLLNSSEINFNSYVDKTKYHKNHIENICGNNFIYDNFYTSYTKANSIRYNLKCPTCDHEQLYDIQTIERNKGCVKCFSNKVSKYSYSLPQAEKYKDKWLNEKIFLYLLKFESENELFYKIGLSKNTHKRITCFPKYYNITIIENLKFNKYHGSFVEKYILNNFKEDKYIPNLSFNGATECIKYKEYDYFPFSQEENLKFEMNKYKICYKCKEKRLEELENRLMYVY